MSDIIEIKNLSFGYDKKTKVLDDLSVCFEEGRIITLIGKNGSGKSTLLDCLLGVNEYSGSILIREQDIKDMSDKEYARLVSFIPQSVQINIDYSIHDFISFGRNPHLKLGLSLNNDDYQNNEQKAEPQNIEDQ